MRRKPLFTVHLLLILALAAVPSGPGFTQSPGGGLVEDGDPPDLFLLYTGDVIGFLDPCG